MVRTEAGRDSPVVNLRKATADDMSGLITLDPMARMGDEQRRLIKRTVTEGNCWLAMEGFRVTGYAALEYRFYDQGFISILYVHPEHRRKAIGNTLVRHLEALCITPKIFTSTNLSNLAMQVLLNKLGYSLTGVIHNLDEGDPEIVFMKYLQRT